jgi:hypothetical protein
LLSDFQITPRLLRLEMVVAADFGLVARLLGWRLTVPLSEEEQRMLEQLEQALAAEDPKFASTLRGSSARSRHRRLAFISAGVFVLGIILLMTGVIMPQTIVSVVGFVLMLGGAYFGLTEWRRSSPPRCTPSAPTRAKARARGRARRLRPRGRPSHAAAPPRRARSWSGWKSAGVGVETQVSEPVGLHPVLPAVGTAQGPRHQHGP